jgi:hypothetical protein
VGFGLRTAPYDPPARIRHPTTQEQPEQGVQ